MISNFKSIILNIYSCIAVLNNLKNVCDRYNYDAILIIYNLMKFYTFCIAK